ncbi:MAG: methylenetetrahydrofolate--tRNA-(uracil(54)-C(5))-methyltransferase (FADH(2)-oxidizing) TrmFO, partial [Bacillota bacterium]|nr:methylenetetrahydrofolate--tRNA-(uracil(54)-C(5))-methyltransferase (FADH(2)-oxidizing) TrmFO [Bacillota bacterium]
MKVTVIGGGLAGAEAAWQIARQGVPVELWEMRPLVMTPVHRTGDLAELVCSNSLRSDALENGVGLLKEELRRLGSLIMRCADGTRIPAGKALAVDRHLFSRAVTEAIEGEPLISLRRGEVKEIPRPGVVVVASGPLTSPALAEEIRRWTGEEYLYFYDAVAPIVDGASIDYRRAFWGSRYGREQTAEEEAEAEAGDYLNCPLTEEEYSRFWEALVAAEVVPLAEHDRGIFFEGCLPVEEIARRGRETLRYGPLKPVGLRDPRTGERPYAVVQLRREDAPGTIFNLVGFQTRLKWGEQERVFRLIPALARAEFLRFGVMHRNTYINSHRLLTPAYSLRQHPEVFFAGQITGVEG